MNYRNQPAAWHSLGIADVSEQLNADENRSSDAEAAARLNEYGPNNLPQKPAAPLWRVENLVLTRLSVLSGLLAPRGASPPSVKSTSHFQLAMLALTIFPVMELHKWTWSMRHREPSHV